MSRHIVADKNPSKYWIIGYDRPLDQFFYQLWGPTEDDSSQAEFIEDGYIAELPSGYGTLREFGANITDELIDTLTAEYIGKADTNKCKDWRIK